MFILSQSIIFSALLTVDMLNDFSYNLAPFSIFSGSFDIHLICSEFVMLNDFTEY